MRRGPASWSLLVLALLLMPACRRTSVSPMPVDVPCPAPHAVETVTPPAAPVTPRTPTLGDVRGRILERANLHLAAETYRVAEARGRVVQASLPPNPYVLLLRNRVDDVDLFGTGRTEMEVGAPIELGHKRRARVAQARAEVLAVSEEVRALTALTLQRAEEQFFYILRHQDELVVVREEAEATAKLVTLADRRQREGKDSRVPVLRFEAAAEDARLAVQDLVHRHARACRLLDDLLGYPSGTVHGVDGSWDAVALNELDRDAAARSLARHPRRVAAEEAVRAADRAICRADADAWPDLTIGLRGERDHETDRDYVGLRLHVPVPIWNRNEGARAEARAAAARARKIVEAETLTLATELDAALLAYDTASENVRGYGEQLVPRLESSLDLARSAYEGGKASYLDVLDALLAWIRARRTSVGHLEERAKAAVEIRYLTGL